MFDSLSALEVIMLHLGHRYHPKMEDFFFVSKVVSDEHTHLSSAGEEGRQPRSVKPVSEWSNLACMANPLLNECRGLIQF